MKKIKILTALNNPKINKELNNEIHYDVVGKDVQYKEAILEILEKIKKIDIIIINEKILGEISLEKLVKEIKKINKKIRIIIFFKKQNNENKKNININGIEEIYYKENINLKKLKEIIENKKLINKQKNNKFKKTNIITIYGSEKSGKTFFSILLLKYLKNINKKILIIDFNKNKSKIYFHFKEKYILNKNIIKINNNKIKKIKFNKNIELISELDFLFNNKIREEYIIKFLNQILVFSKNKYDYIIIDIDSKINRVIKEQIIKKSFIKLLILESENLGVKEMQEVIKKNKNFINKKDNSLHIIVNKYKLLYTNIEILKKVFSENIKIKKIDYKKIYTNLEGNFLKIKINRKIEKLFKEILETKNEF